MNQFKVGDWILSKKYSHMRPVKITSIYESNEREGDLGLKCSATVHYASESEHWQPKEGEWCWHKIYGLIKIVKLLKEYHVQQAIVHLPFKDKDEQIPLWFCEPFIGQLPSFLKDK